MILYANDKLILSFFKIKMWKGRVCIFVLLFGKKGEGNQCVIRYLFVRESVNISGLNNSVARLLARYARGPGFESQLRLDFSPPVIDESV